MLWCMNFLKSLCLYEKKQRVGDEDDEEGDEDKEGDQKDSEKGVDATGLQTQRRGRYLLGSLGALFVALSSATYILDPVELITKKAMQLSDGSYAYRLWKKPPIPAHLKIHIFNYTNTEAFLRGEESLRVNEVGPYVFSVFFENKNVTFNKNNTVSYVPQRRVFENLQKTNGDIKKDVVVALNTPLLGVASYLSNASFFTKMAFSSVTAMLDMKPFLTMTVEEYLWGYEDPLIKHANKFLPNIVNFDKLGYMDRIFDEGKNLLTMNLNSQPEIRSGGQLFRPMTLERFNGKAGLRYYGYDDDDVTTHRTCNTLEGVASDGMVFPRHIAKNSTFLIYRKIFCRTMPIVFERAGMTDSGVPAYWFKFPEDAFDNTNPENSCYCRPQEKPCFLNGLSEIASCYWDMPAAASYPHFLYMNTSDLKTVEGLNPDVEQHGSTIVIQQDLGVMMKAHTRIQVNLVMGDMRYSGKLKPFNGLVLPILWADYCFEELPGYILFFIHLLVVVLPVIQYCCVILFGVVGVVCLTAFLARTIYREDDNHRRKWDHRDTIREYDKLKIVPVVREEHFTVM